MPESEKTWVGGRLFPGPKEDMFCTEIEVSTDEKDISPALGDLCCVTTKAGEDLDYYVVGVLKEQDSGWTYVFTCQVESHFDRSKRELADSLNSEKPRDAIWSPECDKCHGTGWTAAPSRLDGDYEYECVTACACNRAARQEFVREWKRGDYLPTVDGAKIVPDHYENPHDR